MRFAELGEIADEVQVSIEVPRGSFVKRRPDGSVDFVSPFPCPYNYGSIVGTQGADGDPLDAVVLGPRRSPGTRVHMRVRAVIGFVDDDAPDPKIICASRPLSSIERRGVHLFFRTYATFKRMVNRMRGRTGRTCCTGWLPRRD